MELPHCYKLVDCSDEFTYDEEIDNEDSDPDGDQSQPKDSETVPPV
jgi:hypothetical protein